MKRNDTARPRWSTSSFGSAPDTSPLELAALVTHLKRCNRQRDSLFALRCVGEAMDEFAAPRLISTVALLAMLGSIVVLLT